MSLRVKFLILILGTVLSPFVVFIISYGIEGDLGTIRKYHDGISQYREWKAGIDGTTVDTSRIRDSLDGLPKTIEVRVFDESGELLYN